MGNIVQEFNTYRTKMNKKILGSDSKVMKRIYSLDTLTYQDGALSSKVKEMLGLATSMVLRCDDCIKYHLEKCFELGITTNGYLKYLEWPIWLGAQLLFRTQEEL